MNGRLVLSVFMLAAAGTSHAGLHVGMVSAVKKKAKELRDEKTSVERKDYRQDMRDFVKKISDYSRNLDGDFIVIPQNGQELVTLDGTETGRPAAKYLGAIDGVGREDLFYGYEKDNSPTDEEDTEYMKAFLDVAEENGLTILVTDYCSDKSSVLRSYEENGESGYISFAADSRELDGIPGYPEAPFNSNDDDIKDLADAENFLYLLNPDSYGSKGDFLRDLRATDYDILIIDLYFQGEDILTASDVRSLKKKDNGSDRLVIAYMSIGEAEDYRYYWDEDWNDHPPYWLCRENPDWVGNYKVMYWADEWQDIICGGDDSYLERIIGAGFDGVYLDIIDAFEYFEEK
ncbi:MAG: endo alpha-1,4 polygalactosaminidase [Elusimicrobia bacterium]|nr:endo alpha-1,4 polygalactosaminidase [Elusimicrobiota bacterium]